ncbi:putative tricarboxylic transport membrane protein [Rhodococcoides kroppenstedtii]|uniref:Putative tricarboxylic transport membrane protein n=1 Tax=Rhodococcoides kroppenstedtii TaxID=293050 RepID=A0A1I0SQI6_9NOCA|nr:tripartite tricarboxylate transporter TctB family protein [Rhodococcus kroppenstedtii]SFA41683.1 putative tricarboxylic transport membrane protein [Rhodococcus kroppenstedtii]
MTTDVTTPGHERFDEHPRAGGFRRGRSGLVVAGLVLALAIYLTHGILTMEVPGSAATPGPAFFPVILTVCAYLLAILLAVQVLRTPDSPDPDIVQPRGGRHRTQSDWRALGITLAAFLLFTAMLVPVGWVISAAVLFWGVAYAMGSPRPTMDLGIALVFSCGVQAFFSAGLGLNLPAGILEGLL